MHQFMMTTTMTLFMVQKEVEASRYRHLKKDMAGCIHVLTYIFISKIKKKKTKISYPTVDILYRFGHRRLRCNCNNRHGRNEHIVKTVPAKAKYMKSYGKE